MAELRKWGFFPRGSEMPWSRTFSPVVHVSLWDFLLAYSFTPVSGLCRSSFSLWLLIRHVTRPDCHPKVNWRICARDPLIMANLLGFTLPTVTVHRNTTIPSTTQKGSSKTKRVVRCDCKPASLDSSSFPHLPHLQKGKDRGERTQTGPFDFP